MGDQAAKFRREDRSHYRWVGRAPILPTGCLTVSIITNLLPAESRFSPRSTPSRSSKFSLTITRQNGERGAARRCWSRPNREPTNYTERRMSFSVTRIWMLGVSSRRQLKNLILTNLDFL